MKLVASHDTARPRPAAERNLVPGLALALPAAIFVLILIWARTTLVPGASTGDEVWWSESGYFFMKEGVLRWACMANDKGSQVLSFWPPLPAMVQALTLKIFGVNAWGVNAQTSLVSTLVMVVAYGLGRVLSLSRAQALWASIAIFGLFSVERRLLVGRMENLTALSALVFALLLLRGAREDKSRRQMFEIASGLGLGLGFFTYYPQSPFLALAAVVVLILQPRRWFQCMTNVGLGALPVVVAGGLWILPHWHLFRSQVLEVGASHYASSHVIWDCIKMLWHFSQLSYWVLHTERWAVLMFCLGCCCWVRDPRLRALSAMAAVLSLPMFAYTWSPNVVSAAPGVLCVIILFGLAPMVTIKPLAFGVAAFQACLVCSACVKLALIGFSAYYQREGRDYQAVASALKESISGDGPVAIEQRAWLGLRERVPADRLHLLVGDVGATAEFTPQVVRRKDAEEYFRYLVLEKELIPFLCGLYPWLDRGIHSGRFQLVREIAPPFRPLPWARRPCYDLLVYERKDQASSNLIR